jgi:potassium channel subfamily K
VVFWKAEAKSQGLSYFEALYFCYVSLLTIGYGDRSPKSNAGKPFFILWSLIAVPTMTILVNDMGNTVIVSFKRGTFTLADWTVLPKAGVWRTFVEKHPWLLQWLQKKAAEAEQRAQEAATRKRIAEGFPAGPADEDINAPPATLEEIIQDEEKKNFNVDEQSLGRRLALAIRRTAHDLKTQRTKHYSYEEWVEFTRLIRFTRLSKGEMDEAEDEQGLVEWDWIGENSPMLADEGESEWLLDRLCESLDRYMTRHYKMRNGRETGGKYQHDHGLGHGHDHDYGHNEWEKREKETEQEHEYRNMKKRKTG